MNDEDMHIHLGNLGIFAAGAGIQLMQVDIAMAELVDYAEKLTNDLKRELSPDDDEYTYVSELTTFKTGLEQDRSKLEQISSQQIEYSSAISRIKTDFLLGKSYGNTDELKAITDELRAHNKEISVLISQTTEAVSILDEVNAGLPKELTKDGRLANLLDGLYSVVAEQKEAITYLDIIDNIAQEMG